MAGRIRLGWIGRAIAFVALAAIALASFEGLVLVFQIFTDNRLVHVTQAEASVERAQRAVAAIEQTQALAASDIAQRAREVNDAERQIKDVSDKMPKPAKPGGLCFDKRGRRVSCCATTPTPGRSSARMTEYNARLSLAMKAPEVAQRNLDAAHAKAGAVDVAPATNQLSDSKEENCSIGLATTRRPASYTTRLARSSHLSPRRRTGAWLRPRSHAS